MPYPFGPSIRFDEFLRKAKESFGVTVELTDGELVGPRGGGRVSHLRRTVGGQTFLAPMPDLEQDGFLLPTVLRSLCARLDLPLKEFGLHLG